MNKKISGVTAGVVGVVSGAGSGGALRARTAARVDDDDRGRERSSARPVKRSAGQELTALLIVALGAVLFLSLISYQGDGSNWMGSFGQHLAGVLLHLLGLGSFLLAGVVAAVGGLMLVGVRVEMKPSEFVGQMLFVMGGGVFFHLWMPGQKVLSHMPGGAVGALGGEVGRSFFGGVGVWLICLVVAMGGLMLAADASLGNVMAKGWRGAKVLLRRVKEGVSGEWTKRREVKAMARDLLDEAPPEVEAAAPAPTKPAPVKPAPTKPALTRSGFTRPSAQPVAAATAPSPTQGVDGAVSAHAAFPGSDEGASLDTLPPVEAAGGMETARHRVASILARLPQGVSVERRAPTKPSADPITDRAATESSPDLLASWNPGARSRASARHEERASR